MTKPLSVLTISDVFKAINRLNRLRRKRMPNSRRVQKAAMEAINEMMMETDETFIVTLTNPVNGFLESETQTAIIIDKIIWSIYFF